jgi:hypothetical protein
MDRPFFRLASSSVLLSVGVLATLTLSSGCRSTRSEVPPGKPYARTGDQPPSVGFSTQPHPAEGGMNPPYNMGPGGMTDDRLAGVGGGQTAEPLYGTPTDGSKGVDLPTANAYGPPGTSGFDPRGGAGAADIARSLMDTGQSVSKSLTDDPSVKAAASLSPDQ